MARFPLGMTLYSSGKIYILSSGGLGISETQDQDNINTRSHSRCWFPKENALLVQQIAESMCEKLRPVQDINARHVCQTVLAVTSHPT